MQLPDKYIKLYKHWQKHVSFAPSDEMFKFNTDVFDQVIAFFNERMQIFEKKYNGEKPPYTQDPILRDLRFCNIYRELDKQTIYFHKLLKPLEKDFSLWLLNMLFCRSICRPETIEKTGLLYFDKKNNQKVYEDLLSLPSPKYGTAYIFPISLIQKSNWNTREKFFCLYYPQVIKKVAEKILTFDDFSVSDALEIILPEFGFNLKFLWTEVLIDTAYQFPNLVNLFKRFPIGPGSLPTMKSLSPSHKPEELPLILANQKFNQINYLELNNKPILLSAENWEGIGCEFRKYSNLKMGKGRRRKYN